MTNEKKKFLENLPKTEDVTFTSNGGIGDWYRSIYLVDKDHSKLVVDMHLYLGGCGYDSSQAMDYSITVEIDNDIKAVLKRLYEGAEANAKISRCMWRAVIEEEN